MARSTATACVLAIAIAAPACGDRGPRIVSDDAATPVRRVIERPTGEVHPLPPHAIRNDEVGPYRLGQPLATVLYDLPSGPRIEVLDIPDIVRLAVIRAEDGKVMIGGEPMASTSFVSVVAPEVARTESGVEVGIAVDELIEKLGKPVIDASRAADPRLVVPASLPGVRFVVVDKRVVAAMVGGAANAQAQSVSVDAVSPPGPPPCETVAQGDALDLGCLPDGNRLAAIDDDLIVATTGDRPRRLASMRFPGLVFAGPIRGAGRDEIAVITERRDRDRAVWSLAIVRWENGRLARVLDETLYDLAAVSAGWIGSRLDWIDVALVVDSLPDGYEVSGVLLAWSSKSGPVRDALPLVPISIARRKRAPDPPPSSSRPLGDAAERSGPASDAAGSP
jgi:hypothetical protein